MGAGVVVCTWTGGERPGSESEEVLTLGRRVADQISAPLAWLVVGPFPREALGLGSRFGAGVVHRIEHEALNTFRPDVYVECLARYCREENPQLMLFSQTFEVRLVAPRLAGRLRAGVVMNAVGLEVEEGKLLATAAAYGGDTRVVHALVGPAPHVVAVLPNAVLPEPTGGGEPTVRAISMDLSDVQERIQVVSPAKAEGPRLEDASVIVAGGRGLGNAANFRLVEELAAALGGMAAASRPLVDDGWVDASRQVGLTGKIVRPALYVAAGISGASQHMAGCSAAKTLVAINRDPGAAIFRYARYGIVGDCLEILPELTKAVQAR